MKRIKKVTDLLSLYFAIGFTIFIIIGIYIGLKETGLNTNALTLLIFLASTPIVGGLICFIVNTYLYSKKKETLTVEQVLYRSKVFPIYLQVNNYFKFSMQNKLLTRGDILEFKDMLNKVLKGNTDKYKNEKFKNDAHEIYTKMKDTHISEDNMLKLKDYLEPYVVSYTLKMKQETKTARVSKP